MTGIELLKNNLALKGFNGSKIASNMALIEAVVSIVANNPDADIAMSMAEKKLSDAEKKLHEAEMKENQSLNYMLESRRNKEKADIELGKAERCRYENDALLKEIKECMKFETAEARDKARLLELFKQNLPAKCEMAQNAVIYSMGGILGSGIKVGAQK